MMGQYRYIMGIMIVDDSRQRIAKEGLLLAPVRIPIYKE
jgi:hypothetical protein